MNQFVGNVDKLFNGMEMKVPAQVAEMAEANLEQARLIYAKAAENIKSYGEVADTALSKQQALARGFSNRMLENANENVGAALDLAQKLARSRSVQDMIKIQIICADAREAHRRADERESVTRDEGRFRRALVLVVCFHWSRQQVILKSFNKSSGLARGFFSSRSSADLDVDNGRSGAWCS